MAVVYDDELSAKPLAEPLLPTGEQMEGIAQVVIGTAVGAIITTLAATISAQYQASIYFAIAIILFFWLGYRQRTKG